ncbi:MAG: VWA domain-containing protein [Nostoc sp. NMS2]|uniref:vWA domain-containing protein n=1 Tax=Nostoc sp. NMS2 TaxID=2815389 RepID=UPI0025F96C85|nr:VWA domain-containing protein [Nostoc sp. NMS2]MBN3990668.1 VWA domain-containing protein [Nostoc sp. NMS2]
MLENRDYTLIIDKSASMSTPDKKNGKSRWLALQESTFALATKCEEFDPDGITIYLFAKEFQRYDHVTSAKVKQIFTENIPGDTTNLAGVLQDAINNYFQRKANSQTKPAGEVILVVTDGTQGDRQAVYEIIINATQRLENPQELRISLIQVGADTKATKFLNALDVGLQSVGAKFDICDTITLEELEEMSLTDVLIKAITD